jgi:hypothetical protein
MGQSESVNRRRTDNTMAKRYTKHTHKLQNLIQKLNLFKTAITMCIYMSYLYNNLQLTAYLSVVKENATIDLHIDYTSTTNGV